jgi:nicotinamidase-related amidase
MRISVDNTAGIIIDIQERLFPHIFKNDELERNVEILIQGLNILKVPLMVTEQYSKGLGSTIPSVKNNFTAFKPIEKISFSCCDESRFLRELNLLNKKYIVLAGIEAHVCVLQTVIDLVESGYHPVLVEDCVSSRKEKDKMVAIDRMRREGAIITTYESVLLELCRVAGTETFKKISSLIK